MPKTELVVVGNNGKNIDSVYQLAENGLFLPPMLMTLEQIAKAQQSAYPEFAKELIEVYNKPMTTQWQYGKVTLPAIPLKPKEPTLVDLVPDMNKRFELICPQCGIQNLAATVQGSIIHLNDDHRWPREKIANWLDTLPIDLSIRKVA